jgi:hypothetical protein
MGVLGAPIDDRNDIHDQKEVKYSKPLASQ